ncbi:MAG TPA: winged helix-turn-helix domain-containing protein [Gemmatimonadaceae bacterium]|nr:winged helix-turn-helix domain-containing protein [Gemmatimonadaceae bacterium]
MTRVVTRNELLEHFWEGRDVYDATLTQCVVAIRRALDDHHGDTRFIETRWAGGYRYIGPVEQQAVGGGPSVVEVERTRGVKIVVEQEFQDAPPPGAALDAVTMPARADAAPTSPTGDAGSRIAVISLPARRSSRKTSAVVLAVAVVAFAAAALLAYRGPARRADFETGSSPPRSIAVLPFRNLTGDPAQEYFSDGLTESFITDFQKLRA